MPLVKTMDMLADCARGRYAVGAFNINALDQTPFLVKKAEELKSPILLVEPGVIEPYMNFEDYATVTARAARDAKVPVGIHLSHGLNLEQTERAIKAGFTSVMYDGSKLPYEENVRTTKIAVEMGHKMGCAVEGELGALGSSFVNISETMTDPALARDFVERTGVDILAVAIGNAHGFYKGTPALDFKRLEEIKYAIAPYPCYLTLHGGSGIPFDHIRRAIDMGIVKICIYTEMCHEGRKNGIAWFGAHPEYTGNFDTPDLNVAIMEGYAKAMESSMDMFMSIGKAGADMPTLNVEKKTFAPTAMPQAAAAAPAPAGNPLATSGDVPVNTDIGPAYPSLVAENHNFKSTGRYWDKNI